ncbi:MAG: peptidoglycan-binding protein [Candidatus Pacebacteria bacterium]|nr:peptidoglycan-binding protein [Candidatus Paceibacterota bacterium]MBP9866918.1 peptidoglycan-binding protein [Candidatus Paceibacterota bacterium]
MKKYYLSALLLTLSLSYVSAQVVDTDTSDTISTCTTITTNISYKNRKNNNKADVMNLQDFLNSTGYLNSDSITGFFGRVTESAVAKFQKDNGLVANPAGFVGAGTRAKIKMISCSGNTGVNTDSSNVNVNTNILKAESWKTYTNKEKGYQIKYPFNAKLTVSNLSCLQIDTVEFGSVYINSESGDPCGTPTGVSNSSSNVTSTLFIDSKEYNFSGRQNYNNAYSFFAGNISDKLSLVYGVEHRNSSSLNPEELGSLTETEYQKALDSAKKVLSTFKILPNIYINDTVWKKYKNENRNFVISYPSDVEVQEVYRQDTIACFNKKSESCFVYIADDTSAVNRVNNVSVFNELNIATLENKLHTKIIAEVNNEGRYSVSMNKIVISSKDKLILSRMLSSIEFTGINEGISKGSSSSIVDIFNNPNLPEGCKTTSGFSPITGVKCSSGLPFVVSQSVPDVVSSKNQLIDKIKNATYYFNLPNGKDEGSKSITPLKMINGEAKFSLSNGYSAICYFLNGGPHFAVNKNGDKVAVAVSCSHGGSTIDNFLIAFKNINNTLIQTDIANLLEYPSTKIKNSLRISVENIDLSNDNIVSVATLVVPESSYSLPQYKQDATESFVVKYQLNSSGKLLILPTLSTALSSLQNDSNIDSVINTWMNSDGFVKGEKYDGERHTRSLINKSTFKSTYFGKIVPYAIVGEESIGEAMGGYSEFIVHPQINSKISNFVYEFNRVEGFNPWGVGSETGNSPEKVSYELVADDQLLVIYRVSRDFMHPDSSKQCVKRGDYKATYLLNKTEHMYVSSSKKDFLYSSDCEHPSNG